jgi:hypothetical protein
VLTLRYRADGHVHLPSPPANVWRGQLGYYLHRIASEERHDQDLSLYQRLFRTPASAVGVPDYDGRVLGPIGLAGEHVPHPFVLRRAEPDPPGTDLHLRRGEATTIEVVLMGTTLRALPQLTAAFEVLGADGLGRRTQQPDGNVRRGEVRLTGASLGLQGVEMELYDGTDWALPPTCGPELYEQADRLAPEPAAETGTQRPLRVRFETAVRLQHGGAVIAPDALDPDALAAPLYRRVVGMAVCYGPEALPARRIRRMQDGFRALADATRLDATDVEWREDTRYSHRQDRRVPAGGLYGAVQLHADKEVCTIWADWLGRAERLHLGKGTSMGLGRLSVLAGGDEPA